MIEKMGTATTCHIANSKSFLPYIRIIVVWVLISCIFSNIGVTEATITWIDKPKDASWPINENVTIPCIVSGRTNEQVFWRKDSSAIIVIGTDNKVSNLKPLRYRVGTFSLTILNVQKEDAGTYECEIFGGYTASGKLTVLIPPGKPVLVTEPAVIEQGVKVTFRCTTTGGNPTPTIEIRGDHLTAPMQVTPTTTGDTTIGVATYDVSSSDDLKNFTCKVSNELDTLQTKKLIRVQYKPEVKILLHSTSTEYEPLVVVENEPSTLFCSVKANPDILGNVVWKKEGVVQPTEVSLQYSPTYRRSDSSKISCAATNSLGTTETVLDVEVHYKPAIKAFPFGSKLTLNETDTLQVKCEFESGSPTPIISWKKQNVPNSEINGVSLFNGRVTRNDSGIYICTASNTLSPSGKSSKLGIAQRSVEIVVQYPAEVLIPKLEYSGFVNETVVITCYGKGVPKPSIQWTGPQGLIPSDGANINPNTVDTTDNGYNVVSKLSIKITDKKHLGQYLCKSINALGAKSVGTELKLRTVDLPMPQEVKYIVEGSELTFKALSGQYCVRIKGTTDDKTWKVIEKCAPMNDGSIKLDNKDIKQVNVSFCWQSLTLTKMCGQEVMAERDNSSSITKPTSATKKVEPEPSVSTQTIYIVAGVGALVVIILIIILVIVCCRRKKPEKEYPEAAHQRPKPVPYQNGSKRYIKPQGLDNPGLDTIDSSGMNYPTVFHTNNQQPNHHHMHMNGYGSYGHMNGYPNGTIPYEHELDNVMKLDDPYLFNHYHNGKYNTVDSNGEIRGDDNRSYNESGYSTPDPTKHKKKGQRSGNDIYYGDDRSGFAHDPVGHQSGTYKPYESMQRNTHIRKSDRKRQSDKKKDKKGKKTVMKSDSVRKDAAKERQQQLASEVLNHHLARREPTLQPAEQGSGNWFLSANSNLNQQDSQESQDSFAHDEYGNMLDTDYDAIERDLDESRASNQGVVMDPRDFRNFMPFPNIDYRFFSPADPFNVFGQQLNPAVMRQMMSWYPGMVPGPIPPGYTNFTEYKRMFNQVMMPEHVAEWNARTRGIANNPGYNQESEYDEDVDEEIEEINRDSPDRDYDESIRRPGLDPRFNPLAGFMQSPYGGYMPAGPYAMPGPSQFVPPFGAAPGQFPMGPSMQFGQPTKKPPRRIPRFDTSFNSTLERLIAADEPMPQSAPPPKPKPRKQPVNPPATKPRRDPPPPTTAQRPAAAHRNNNNVTAYDEDTRPEVSLPNTNTQARFVPNLMKEMTNASKFKSQRRPSVSTLSSVDSDMLTSNVHCDTWDSRTTKPADHEFRHVNFNPWSTAGGDMFRPGYNHYRSDILSPTGMHGPPAFPFRNRGHDDIHSQMHVRDMSSRAATETPITLIL